MTSLFFLVKMKFYEFLENMLQTKVTLIAWLKFLIVQ